MIGNLHAYDGESRKFNTCNALLQHNNQSYSYDLNGNRISDGSHTYKYDALDRLIEVTTNNGKFNYVYDALGRRVAKIHNGQMTYFLWQKQQEIGAISKEGIIKELEVLDTSNRAIAFELQDKLYVPIHDSLGHVRGLLDSSGKCVATYRYSAFGEEEIQGDILSPWRYSGKRVDAETGLIYFGARYYDSKTCCWLTPDPLEDIDGPNHYAYVLNNPMKYTDPDGRFAFAIPLFTICWGAGSTSAAFITAEALLASLAGAVLGVIVYQGAQKLDQVANGEEKPKKTEPRTKPKDLDEQLALEEAKGGSGKEIMEGKIKDPYYPQERYKKMQHTHVTSSNQTISIHYWENRTTGEREQFKFKNE